jgi:hypothetical protein
MHVYRYHPRQNKMSFRWLRASFIYRLYGTVARMEPWGTPAAITFGVENSFYTNTFNFLVAKKAVSLLSLVENHISVHLYRRPECHFVSKAFWISKNTATAGITIFEIKSDSIRQPHTLKCQTDYQLATSFTPLLWIVLKISFSNSLRFSLG